VYPFPNATSNSDALFMVIDGHDPEGAEVSQVAMEKVTLTSVR
jgi:hypothetical protein